MSGHSKWNSIKHQKAANDKKKGAIFTRVSRNITLAAREGGGDPESNFKLKMAVDQAKAANMPKDNVERAIKRGTGESNEGQLLEMTYEGYGPGGVAIIITTITDNNNRTVSEVRSTLTKNGGSMADSGSVLWNFAQKGVIRLETGTTDKDALELSAIEAGAEDLQSDNDGIAIITEPKNLQRLKEEIEKTGVAVEYAGMEFVPQNTIDLPEGDKAKLEKLVDVLEELEDVNEVYTNES